MGRLNLKYFPKVELHRHLDGSVRFETIKDLAHRHKIDLGIKSEKELLKKTKIPGPMENLQEVLDCFWTTQKVLCSYEALKRVTFENIEDAYRDGVKLLELRFASVFIAEGKNLGNDEIIEGVIDGITQGMEKYDIQVGLIHILPRALNFEKNLLAHKDILKYRQSSHLNADRLCGFDLADAEKGSFPEDFVQVVDEARRAGLGITIHSGEDTDAASVKKTLEVLAPTRIGHGIRIAQDEEVMKMAIERNVHFEICPTSNWLTKAVEDLSHHPIPLFLTKGLSFSLNTDDPHLMGIDLIHEYELAQQRFGLREEDFQKINQEAFRHSFLNPEVKAFVQKNHFPFIKAPGRSPAF